MSTFHPDRRTGNAVEEVILKICQLQNIPAYLNPTPDPDDAPDEQTRQLWYEGRAAYDISIAGIPFDVKADWASWYYRNFCIERNAIQHTRADYFIYAIPKPSSLTFHVISVPDLFTLYNSGRYVRKIVGEQRDNEAVNVPLEVLNTTGQNFWQFTRQLQSLTKAA